MLAWEAMQGVGAKTQARWRVSGGGFGPIVDLSTGIAGGAPSAALNASGDAVVAWASDRDLHLYLRPRTGSPRHLTLPFSNCTLSDVRAGIDDGGDVVAGWGDCEHVYTVDVPAGGQPSARHEIAYPNTHLPWTGVNQLDMRVNGAGQVALTWAKVRDTYVAVREPGAAAFEVTTVRTTTNPDGLEQFETTYQGAGIAQRPDGTVIAVLIGDGKPPALPSGRRAARSGRSGASPRRTWERRWAGTWCSPRMVPQL